MEVAPGVHIAWLCLLSACTAWRALAGRSQALPLLRSPLARLALAGWLWASLSWWWALDRPAALLAMLDGYEGCLILLAVALLAPARRHGLLAALTVSTLAISLLGLHQFFCGFDLTRRYLQQAHPAYLLVYHVRMMLESKRIFAAFFSPDLLAGYLAAMTPLVMAWGAQGRRERFLAAGTLLAVIPALVLTRSLGGLLALAAAFGVGVRLARERVRLHRGWWAAGAVLLALCGVALAGRWAALVNLAYTHNPVARRFNYWSFAWTLIMRHPWIGHGAGGFAAAYATVEGAARWPTQMAHNTLLQWWVELGAAGVLINGALVVVWLRQAWRAARAGRPFAWGVCVAGIALLLHGLVDYDFAVNQVAFVWWVLVGWIAHAARHDAAA